MILTTLFLGCEEQYNMNYRTKKIAFVRKMKG